MTNIYQKLAKVMSQVNRVPKNGYNSFHKYQYATETDLTESIRPILLEAGLAFFSSVLEQEREGEFTKVKMEFILADIENGDKLTSTYWGEGQDKGDKGLYKAYTGATKYFLMKTFLIPTGDDPEGDTTADERNQNKKPQQQKQTQNNSQGHYEPKKISPNQLKLLNTLITRMDKEQGHSRDVVINTLKAKPGIGEFESTKDLSVGQASKAIETLQNALGDK